MSRGLCSSARRFRNALAQTLLERWASAAPTPQRDARMYARAAFAGLLVLPAAALLALGCSDSVTSDRRTLRAPGFALGAVPIARSEEHTSELQSRVDLVCRLL